MQILESDRRTDTSQPFEVQRTSNGRLVLATVGRTVILDREEKDYLVKSFISPEMRKFFDSSALEQLFRGIGVPVGESPKKKRRKATKK